MARWWIRMSQMRRSRSEAWESGRVPSFQLRSIVSGANKQISYVNADAIYAMLVNSMPPCLKTNIDQTLSSLTLAHDFIQVQFDVLYHLVRVVIVSATLRSRASDVCLKIGHTPPPEVQLAWSEENVSRLLYLSALVEHGILLRAPAAVSFLLLVLPSI